MKKVHEVNLFLNIKMAILIDQNVKCFHKLN